MYDSPALALGSWADEMENLPTAPAARASDDAPSDSRFGRSGGGLGGDRDFASRPDRGPSGPPREDLPLPTAPPYTVFVGNLAFDLVEDDLAGFFAPESLKSVKVIRDRDEKPKGFGYVEFETLDGLKNGLDKSGSLLKSRTVRVSVAEPPKERESRSGFGSFGDDAANWRREGPPPTVGGGRSRFDDRPPREPVEPSVADTVSDWRSNRPARPTPPPEEPSRRSGFRDAPPRAEMTWERKGTLVEHAAQADRPSNFRRGSGFNTPSGDRESAPLSAAETDEVWTRGPPRQTDEQQPPRRGAFGGRGGDGPQLGTSGLPESGDWRSQMKSPVVRQGSTDKSPTSSQPTTPQGNRKRLELLPRSQTGSNVASPLSSPRMNAAPAAKANPFGAAKPIDVSAKDREVTEKLEKDRESRLQNKPASNPFGNARPSPMSRQGSTSGGPASRTQSTPRDESPAESDKDKEASNARVANKFDAKAAQVRAQTSFAAAAGKKDDSNAGVKEVTDKVAEVSI
ncbi:RNA recognition motif protein [Ceratobasidium sp. AG-Ba]|nr:RNA recognition motif protein [Ceratobasidium sp. AG-Ba]QRW03648.1 RNA recognition motif protein [Ceratobasidium sp. AG-Ba]